MTKRRTSDWMRGNALGLVAIFIALTGGTAYATHPGGQNTISSADIIDDQIRGVDIRANNVREDDIGGNAVISRHIKGGAVQSSDVRDDTVNNGGLNAQDLNPGSVGTSEVEDGSLTGGDVDLSTFPFWRLGGNAGTDPATDFLGTTDAQPLNFRVNDQRALRIEPRPDPGEQRQNPNLIGGGGDNEATAGVHSATIGGGGNGPFFFSGDCCLGPHQITGNFGTVGGGQSNRAATYGTVAGGRLNQANGSQSTVGGGSQNFAGGALATIGGGGGFDLANTASAQSATIGGGGGNTASGQFATVGGGGGFVFSGNTASAESATIGGGAGNTASGPFATVPGGQSNTAQGQFSLAVGRRAKANHDGAFVWADSSDFDFLSAANNQFRARTTGGAHFVSAIDGSGNASAGVFLAPGGGSWGSISDRAAKEALEPVSGREVLAKLAALPVSTWSYRSQDDGIRHIGPMAQDFYEAFGVGEDRRHITSIDADGVALAAIQGLNRKLNRKLRMERQHRIEQERRIARLEARISVLARAGR